jgi:hypothetical protein
LNIITCIGKTFKFLLLDYLHLIKDRTHTKPIHEPFKRKNKIDLPIVTGILIFNDVEVLDVTGPFEVFSMVRLNEEHCFDEDSPFKVILISENLKPVLAMGGLQLILILILITVLNWIY